MKFRRKQNHVLILLKMNIEFYNIFVLVKMVMFGYVCNIFDNMSIQADNQLSLVGRISILIFMN